LPQAALEAADDEWQAGRISVLDDDAVDFYLRIGRVSPQVIAVLGVVYDSVADGRFFAATSAGVSTGPHGCHTGATVIEVVSLQVDPPIATAATAILLVEDDLGYRGAVGQLHQGPPVLPRNIEILDSIAIVAVCVEIVPWLKGSGRHRHIAVAWAGGHREQGKRKPDDWHQSENLVPYHLNHSFLGNAGLDIDGD
jgi:hypothetical protein